ncbi:50S ribosomal protein L19 [bacterium]|nr:50S ribosomal protein L19 [bacterium]|tara:strand:- start:11953 stop:12279 length:327 start_codon:yes stop_codon:yes gene_type:complete
MLDEKTIKELRPGIKVKVWEIVKEGDKKRKSPFTGIIIARKHGKEAGATFTVRGIIQEVGVEKVYPLMSPMVDKIDILGKPKRVRKSKLYYIRKLSPKKIQEKLGISF